MPIEFGELRLQTVQKIVQGRRECMDTEAGCLLWDLSGISGLSTAENALKAGVMEEIVYAELSKPEVKMID